MKTKISGKSVINMHFVSDFVDTVKSVTTEKEYPEKATYKGNSHVAECKLGVITVKKSMLSDTSKSFDDSINAQLNVEQYTSGNKDPSNSDIKDNVIYDDKSLKTAVDSQLDINGPRAQDIKREEQFLGEDSGSDKNVDGNNNKDGYTKIADLDTSDMSDITTRCRNSGVEIEISDVSDDRKTTDSKTTKNDKKDEDETNNDSYE